MYNDILLGDALKDSPFAKGENSKSLDSMFENLTNDVQNFNNFISSLNDQKKVNSEEEREILEEKQRLEHARAEFDNYMNIKREELTKKEKEFDNYLKVQQDNLLKSELNFKNNMDNALSELDLAKKELEIEREKTKAEKAQFEAYKSLEIDRIHQAEQILASEKTQFERYKEITNQKIELENKNFEQKCSKFKDILAQFNSNFKPIIENKEG